MWWSDKRIWLLILFIAVVSIAALAWNQRVRRQIERERAALTAKAPAVWGQVRVGMTRREVVTRLGEPPLVHSFTNSSPPAPSAAAVIPAFPREVWHYAFGESGAAFIPVGTSSPSPTVQSSV